MKKVLAVLLAVLATVLFSSGCASPCRHFVFHEVTPEIFVGCRPTKQADFDQLRNCGIRTIISYESFTWHVGPEKQKAARNHFAFRNVPVFASPLGPSEKSMRKALCVLNDASLRPVYVHCLYGRDRTVMILGLYQVYYQGVSPEDAWKRMLKSGYKTDWSLWGFKRYFWQHTRKPEWVTTDRSSSDCHPE
jgi:protein-tyrosine phosphatase